MFILNWRNPALPYTQKQTAIQIQNQTVNTTSSSLTLPGMGYANYGAFLNENFLRLLENFASDSAPANGTVGQLWYDTTNKILNVCIATAPESVSPTWFALHTVNVKEVGDTPPSNPKLGDIWYQKTGTLSGITYVYTGVGRYPETSTTIGGWEQTTPQINVYAGREEYNVLRALVMNLIGDSTVGGSGAYSRYVTYPTDLTVLDTDLHTKWNASQDTSLLLGTTDTSELLVDPNSNDWDGLLAAAKYAISRLDVPQSYVNNISQIPFVYDGRQPPAILTGLATNDLRYPSLERRSLRKFGQVTMNRLFTDTVNALKIAKLNQYKLQGITGTSGVNSSFSSNVVKTAQVSFTCPGNTAALGTPGLTTGLDFVFSSSDELNRFFNAGQSVELRAVHTPSGSPTTADNNLKSITDAKGILRLVYDNSYVMDTNGTALSVAPNGIGTGVLTSTATTLYTHTFGGASIAITASKPTSTSIRVSATIVGGGTLSGSFSVAWSVINDNTTFNSARVYPLPLTYNVSQKSGSTSFV